MRTVADFVWLVCLIAVAAGRTWWAFRGETGVEADDPEKEKWEVP